MQLWKKLYNFTLNGRTRVPKNQSLDVESGGEIDVESGASLKIAGTAITASAAELNIMDGVTATAAEINRSTDISARAVATTATVLALTITEHAERVVLVNSNTTVANTLTLPVATGSGAKFTVINNIAQTQGSIVVAANGTDVIKGLAIVANSSTTVNTCGFLTSATSDKITFNRTTTGGAGPGDIVEAWDTAANTWTVKVVSASVGNAATPFSAT